MICLATGSKFISLLPRYAQVVIACLTAGIHGTTTAATVAKDLMRTFQSIHFSLMVGIGGGVPSSTHGIQLGDVVVGRPTGVYEPLKSMDLSLLACPSPQLVSF